VEEPTTRRRAARASAWGYIYGTIVVLATIVTGAKAYQEQVGHVALLVLITTVVFWLAHVYAHALAQSVSRNQHLSLAALKEIAHRESSIIEARSRR
jgi:hypothetical protein